MTIDSINDEVEDEDEDELDETFDERRTRRRKEREERRAQRQTPPPRLAPGQTPTTEQLSSFVENEQRDIINRLESKVKNLITQLNQSDSNLKRAQVRFDSQIGDRDEVISRQSKVIANRDREADGFRTQIDTLTAELQKFQEREKELVAEADQLLGRVDQLVNDRSAQVMEINSMQRRMSQLVRQRDTAHRNAADLKTQLVEVRFQRDEAREHVKELTEHRKLPDGVVPREAPAEGPEMLPERLMTWLRQNAPGMPLEDPVAELETILNGSLAMFKTAWPIIAKQVEEVMRQFGKMGWDFKQGKVPLCLGGHCTTNGHTKRPYQCSQWEPKLSPGA